MLAFLLIVGLSFYAMAGSLSGMVGDYLFEQRIRSDRSSLETLAARVAPLLADDDAEALHSQLLSAGGELGGRLLLLDQNGKVQLDSYGEIYGSRLQYPEVSNILVKGQSADYGVHELDSGVELDTSHLLFMKRTGGAWVGYCTAGVVYASDIIGVLMLVSPVQEMMQNLYQLQDQMILIFVLIAAAALLCTLVFSRVITNPIARDLSQDYDISPSRTACLLDTFSCITQGVIPYGAQMLVAISAAAEMGCVVSAFDLIPKLYYPGLLLVCSLVAMFASPKKRGA